MGAAVEGDTDTVQYLLNRGADPLAVDQAGLDALDYAKVSKNKSVVRLLRDSKARAEDTRQRLK